MIPFQIEWPDCTSQVSMEAVAFAVFFLFQTTYFFFLEKTFWQILKSHDCMYFSILDSFTIFSF